MVTYMLKSKEQFIFVSTKNIYNSMIIIHIISFMIKNLKCNPSLLLLLLLLPKPVAETSFTWRYARWFNDKYGGFVLVEVEELLRYKIFFLETC